MGGSSGWGDLGKSPKSWNSTGMFCWRWALQLESISESPPSAYPLHLSQLPVKKKQKKRRFVMLTKWFIVHQMGMDNLASIP